MFALKLIKQFARVLDALFSTVIVAPLVAVYWFTTWTISDAFIFPDDRVKSAVTSFSIGFLGQFFVMFYQVPLAKYLTFKNHKLVNVVVTKVFALVIAQTSICLWRGTWIFADLTSTDNNFTIALNIAQNAMIMILSKSFRNCNAALFVVTLDQSENCFMVPTYFKRVVNKAFTSQG